MPAQFQSTSGALWAEQPPASRLDYTLEWKLEGDTLVNSVWTCTPSGPGAPVLDDAANDADTTTIFIDGGTPGRWYLITNTVISRTGRTDSQSFMLLVTSSLPGMGGSSLFPFPPDAVAAIRRDRLTNLARTHLAGITLTDDVIWQKIISAEGEVERALRVWLSPREVLPSHPAYDDEAAALTAAGARVEREPGYDYDPQLFDGERWGLIELRQRPIIAVHWIRFVQPDPGQIMAEIPSNWFRPEGTTNKVNLVPATSPFLAPINAFVMAAMGGGRRVPFMLQIAYRAGLADARARLPDLPSLVQRMATLSLVDDLLMAQSGSVSADGLSQSISFEADKHREAMEHKLANMRDSLQGPRMVVV